MLTDSQWQTLKVELRKEARSLFYSMGDVVLIEPNLIPGHDDGEGLKLALPLARSAFSPLLSAAWLENRSQHGPAAAMRSLLTLWV
jgi:hypothetical protein